MIKKYLVNPEGQIIESKIGWAFKVNDVEKLLEERDQAIGILQSWNDDESPWTETWAFLARISKDKGEV